MDSCPSVSLRFSQINVYLYVYLSITSVEVLLKWLNEQ